MSTSRFPRLAWALVAVALATFAAGVSAKPSNKWRVELNHRADNDGTIVLRISPIDGTPIDVETKVPAGTSENHVAKLLRDSLKATLGEGYHVETDDGEDVLIKKRRDTPDFDLTLVSSSLTGLTIELERE